MRHEGLGLLGWTGDREREIERERYLEKQGEREGDREELCMQIDVEKGIFRRVKEIYGQIMRDKRKKER